MEKLLRYIWKSSLEFLIVGYENFVLAKITGLFKILMSGELRQVTFFFKHLALLATTKRKGREVVPDLMGFFS